MKLNILFATLLALASFTTGHAEALDKAKLDQFFDRLAEKNKAMGSLVIAKDGKILCTRSIGYSQINGSEKKPLTATSRFRIASITKTFTAVMIIPAGSQRPEDHHPANAITSERHPAHKARSGNLETWNVSNEG